MSEAGASVRVHSARWLVPVARPPIADGALLLDGEEVIAVGTRAELQRLAPAAPESRHEGVLMPGLVNAHAHVELSHLAGEVPGGDGLAPWIARLLAERARPAAAVEKAARQAVAGLVARGTVALGDVTNDGRLAPLYREPGLDAVTFQEAVFAPGVPAADGATPTAHSTYTCGPELLRAIAAATGGRVRSIHVEEDPAEAALLSSGAGPLAELLRARGKPVDAGVAQACGISPQSPLRPVEWLDALGVLGRGTLLVHLTFAEDRSLELAARRGAIAVLCPRSNLHVTGRLPPVARIRAAGLPVALGTDSLASSPSLDVLGDVQALARAGVDPAWLLAAATAGGAQALERPRLGALAPGRRPGLISFADAASARDPIAWLAHEAADAPAQRIGTDAPVREVGADAPVQRVGADGPDASRSGS